MVGFGRKSVRGKVVLITGAARGIGAGVARDLAGRGAKLALVGLEADELAKVAADCGPDAGWWEADVTRWEDLERAVAAVVEKYGRIDVVLANAGIAATGFTRSIDRRRLRAGDRGGPARRVAHGPGHAAAPHRGEGLRAAGVLGRGDRAHSRATRRTRRRRPAWRRSATRCARRSSTSASTSASRTRRGSATDMVDNADAHPVFGQMRRSNKGIAGKTYPLSVAVKLISGGIAARARVVHVPRWVGFAKVIRALLPRIVERQARALVPAADEAVLKDIAERGEAESSLVGPGGRAAARSAGAL